MRQEAGFEALNNKFNFANPLGFFVPFSTDWLISSQGVSNFRKVQFV